MSNFACTTVHIMNESRNTPGTQSLGRAAEVLRVVSQAMPRGAGTSDVARSAQLTRPTAHRLLSSLQAEGFVDRDHGTGHWLLGPELYLLGLVAALRYDISELAREHVEALAEATGESAFLSARRGGETVCLLRVDGSFPIRSFVLFEGKRFPLGVASAGLAILSHLPDDEREHYVASSQLDVSFGASHDATTLSERIATTRATGYAVNPGLVVEGSWGMGAAVFDSGGRPSWALSLTGIESRFTAGRQPELGRLLLAHAHRLTLALTKQAQR